MLPAKAERLTWRSTRDELDLALVRAKIDVSNVAFRHAPAFHVAGFLGDVLSKRVAAPTIPLNHVDGRKSGTMEAKPEPTCASEKFYIFQARRYDSSLPRTSL